MRRALTVVLLLAAGCASGVREEPAGFPVRTVTAGEVDVKLEPVRIDGEGASFDVTFDTHSVDLALDVAASSRLTVDGVEWTGARWDGAGPGGHHREGTLTFAASGPARGRAVLRIDGLAQPVEARWTLGG